MTPSEAMWAWIAEWRTLNKPRCPECLRDLDATPTSCRRCGWVRG